MAPTVAFATVVGKELESCADQAARIVVRCVLP